MARNLYELGALVTRLRKDKGLTQDKLATEAKTSRTTVAHLEQGRTLPSPDLLERVCERVGLPRPLWEPFTDPSSKTRYEFEILLAELVGAPVSLEHLDESAVAAAQEQLDRLMSLANPTPHECWEALSELLVYYGALPMTRAFFDQYLGTRSPWKLTGLETGIRAYQKDAIRIFSTFSEAYRAMNSGADLAKLLAPLALRSDEQFRRRRPWDQITQIDQERLADLGYISAAEVERTKAERQALSTFLLELAAGIEKNGAKALDAVGQKRRRRMDSLIRKFDLPLGHGLFSPLFSADADEIRRAAEAVAPKSERDVARMHETQQTASKNLAHYLAADHMDLYVATSMRNRPDFISVNSFVTRLFTDDALGLTQLKLRYFNPTLSWAEDRVAKGLVEALMLKRASLTVYMAQKGDSFGKDSEASVSLGQGKPVIVFVPRLYDPDTSIDSEALARGTRTDLVQRLVKLGDDEDRELDESVDEEALLGRILTLELSAVDDVGLARIARTHWADFDLYGEANRIPQEDGRKNYRKWLDDNLKGTGPPAPVPKELRDDFIGILIAVTIYFEKRARLFRETHPLALQVILSTGVLNGILVVRSVESCAALIQQLLRNDLSLDLRIDEANYRLVETTTESTVRVISRHDLLTRAFSTFYALPGTATETETPSK